MRYSRKQQLVSSIEKVMPENRYVINKREKGQKRFFTCSCCGKKFDLGDSDDYVGAVEQWEQFGGKCYVCFHGLGTREWMPCHVKE